MTISIKKIFRLIIMIVLFLNIFVLTGSYFKNSNKLQITEASADIPYKGLYPNMQPCWFPPYSHYYCNEGNTGCIPTDCNYPD